MVMEPNYNILVLGMGRIGRFLMPAYRALLGDRMETQVFGVRGDPSKVAQLQSQVPFPVSAGNTDRLLRDKRPDVVILATPPRVIPQVVRTQLAPYFEEARREGRPLPDVYTFGPTPSPRFYLEQLGGDARVVKFLPSMAGEKQGVPLQKLGAGFLVFGSPFPPERRARALEVSDLFSHTFVVDQDTSLCGLASKITCYTIADCVCAIADGLADEGLPVRPAQLASAWRAAFRRHTGLEGQGLYPCSEEDAPPEIREFVVRLSEAWYEGILRYTLSRGCGEELARGFHGASFETFALSAQLAGREELEADMDRRATKGGVTEKGVGLFRRCGTAPLRQAAAAWVRGERDPSFFDAMEGLAYTIDLTVNRHAYRLAGDGT